MAAQCPLFHNPKVLCRIKPESRHQWTGANEAIHRMDFCDSNYYIDCEDFEAYLEQQAIGKGKILVVDDEKAFVETLSSFFTTRGYETMTATSAEEALHLLKTDQPALALVDIKLPGLNGLELVKILKRDYPGVKVFIVTGFDEEHKQAAEALKVDAFLAKPLALDQLKKEVARVLGATERRLQFALATLKPAEGTPQAKLLFVLEGMPNEEDNRLARYLEAQFTDPSRCDGNYQVACAFSVNETLEKLIAFKPDIALINFDSFYKTSCGQLCARVQQSPYRPKETIVFGVRLQTAFDKQNVEELGARYVDQHRSFTKLFRAVKHIALRLQNQASAPQEPVG